MNALLEPLQIAALFVVGILARLLVLAEELDRGRGERRGAQHAHAEHGDGLRDRGAARAPAERRVDLPDEATGERRVRLDDADDL